MVITPQTNIKLLKVPFEMDSLNQLTFSNATAQYNYFNSLSDKLEYDECTYQRKDGYMAIPESADTLQSYNYCMYQNEQYGNKWFYAFITNITYESNRVSYVYIKTDVFQTWQFDIEYKRSFIEREHVSNDTIGLHTVPENLELGEYITNSTYTFPIFEYFYIVLAVSVIPKITQPSGGALVIDWENANRKMYNGVFSGYAYIVVDSITYASNLIKLYDKEGRSEAIQSVFIAPVELCPVTSWYTYNSGEYNIKYAEINNTTGTWGYTTVGISRNTTLNGYSPINNKLYVYPYCYLSLDNNTGNCLTLHYEDFTGNTGINFDLEGCLTQGGSVKLIASNYKNVTSNHQYSLMLSKFPICSWNSDVYANWLKQNGINLGLNVISDVGQIISGGVLASTGAGSLAGVGQIASGLTGIASTLGQVYEHSLVPPSVQGNINGGDVNFALELYNPILYQNSIKAEYARIIDNFFSMYGYKVNVVKLPNITGRTNWNYVKTIGCNIVGDIPQKDLQELKNMFDNGVTLWHNPSTFLDYSQSNAIV